MNGDKTARVRALLEEKYKHLSTPKQGNNADYSSVSNKEKFDAIVEGRSTKFGKIVSKSKSNETDEPTFPDIYYTGDVGKSKEEIRKEEEIVRTGDPDLSLGTYVTDSWRTGNLRAHETGLSRLQEWVREDSGTLEELVYAQRYLNKLKEKEDFAADLAKEKAEGVQYTKEQEIARMNHMREIDEELQRYQEKLMPLAKRSNDLRDLFYSTGKAWDNMSLRDKIGTWLEQFEDDQIGKGFFLDFSVKDNVLDRLKVGRLSTEMEQLMWDERKNTKQYKRNSKNPSGYTPNPVSEGLSYIDPNYTIGRGSYEPKGPSLRQMPAMPVTTQVKDKEKERFSEKNQLANKVYGKNLADLTPTEERIIDLQERINTVQERLNNNKADIQDKINTINNGNWFFDPRKINKYYKQAQENSKLKLNDWRTWFYASAEIGSSVSDLAAMGGSMLATSATNKLIQGSVASGNVWVAGAVFATEAAAHYMINSEMRSRETASELFDAYKSKMLQYMGDNKIDIENVVREVEGALINLGYDTKNMTEQQMFEASLAHNIRTSNPIYNQMLKDSEDGLEQLRQTNDALVMQDVVQTMMFSYGGKMLNRAIGLRHAQSELAARGMSHGIDDAARLDDYLAMRNNTIKAGAEGLEKGFMGKTAETMKSLGEGVSRKINRALQKTPNPILAKRIAKGILGTAKKVAGVSVIESTEEGIQHTGQKEYLDGKYHNTDDYSFYDGMVNAAELGGEAWLAYYGLHPDETMNNDEDLRNAMNIGAYVGFLMGNVTAPLSAYGAYKQAQTDWRLRGLVADNYAAAERDMKMELFMDAINRKGSNYTRILNSLEQVRSLGYDGVTDEMIDEDVNLVKKISAFKQSKNLRNIVKTLGYKEKSVEQKAILKNAINTDARFNDQTTLHQTALSELKSLTKSYIDNLSDVALSEMEGEYKAYSQEVEAKKTQELSKLKDKYKVHEEKNGRYYREDGSEILGKERDALVAVADRKVIDFDAFKENYVARVVDIIRAGVVEKLQKETQRRAGDLQALAKETGLDVNLDGMQTIREYVKAEDFGIKKRIAQYVKKLNKQNGSNYTYREVLDELTNSQSIVQDVAKLEKAIAAEVIHRAVLNELGQRRNAYIFGSYNGKMNSLSKPEWTSLTKEQKQMYYNRYMNALKDDAAKAEFNEEKARRIYEKERKAQLKTMKSAADARSTGIERAKMIIENDLVKRIKWESTAIKEFVDQHSVSEQELDAANPERVTDRVQQQAAEEALSTTVNAESTAKPAEDAKESAVTETKPEAAQPTEKQAEKPTKEAKPSTEEKAKEDAKSEEPSKETKPSTEKEQPREQSKAEESSETEPTDTGETVSEVDAFLESLRTEREVSPQEGDEFEDGLLDDDLLEGATSAEGEPVQPTESEPKELAPVEVQPEEDKKIQDKMLKKSEEEIKAEEKEKKEQPKAESKPKEDKKPKPELPPMDGMIEEEEHYDADPVEASEEAVNAVHQQLEEVNDDAADTFVREQTQPSRDLNAEDDAAVTVVELIEEEKDADGNVISRRVIKSSIDPEVESTQPRIEMNDLITQGLIVFNESDNTYYWDPTGSGELSKSYAIDTRNLFKQQQFEDESEILGLSPTEQQNKEYETSKTHDGLTPKNRQKRNRIHSTFFYQNASDEVMPITVAGVEVEFTTIDGKKAERAPGSELAKKLAIPGWLNSADDVYYIVTSSTHAMAGQDAIDGLAVHMIIEKDGVVYNTSLRTVDKAKYDLERLGLPEDQQNIELLKLRLLRANIIATYAPDYSNTRRLPTTPLKHAKPVNLRISNGTIKNEYTIDENGARQPVYRKLNDVEDWGLPTDIHEISRVYENGEFQLGIGVGPLTLDHEPFEIARLDAFEEPCDVQATGYAGKIYFISKPEQTPSQQHVFPVMLAEETHRQPGWTSLAKVELVRDHRGRHLLPEGDSKRYEMSSAEMVYELAINGLYDESTYPGLNDAVLKILANVGGQTLAMNDERSVLDWLVRKQFHVHGIGSEAYAMYAVRKNLNDPNSKSQLITKYVRNFTLADKQIIVWNIARNIHWNTDRVALNEPLHPQLIKFIIDRFKNNPKLGTHDEIFLSTKALRFSLYDIGYERKEDGSIVKVSEPPKLIAWYIAKGILKTDVGTNVYDAPFVYADGVTSDSEVAERQSSAAAATRKKVSVAPVKDKTDVEQTETTTKPVAEPTTEVEQSKPAQDAVEAKPKVERVRTVDASKVTKPLSVSSKELYVLRATPENLAEYGLEPSKQGRLQGADHQFFIVEDLKNKGTYRVVQLRRSTVNIIGEDTLTSVHRGQGKMNKESARKWLTETLGVDPSNIMVTRAVMRTHHDAKVYGVMRAVVDSITGEIRPQIVLSTEAGAGIEYHEGFHYVTQLLMTESEREALYQDYIDRNPKAKNYTKKEVEEALAEEFRAFMLREQSPTLGYKVIKFFKNIVRYMKAMFGKPYDKRIYQVFNAIKQGEINKDFSEETVKEFHNKFDSGLFYYVPGLTKEEQKSIPNILDSTTFYNAVKSLTTSALNILDVRTMQDLQNANSINEKGVRNIDAVFDYLEDLLTFGNIPQEYEDVAKDVLENKDLFRRHIVQNLEQFGITEIENSEIEAAQQLSVETGESIKEVWDKHQGDINKKANVSFNAKLFFYSMPKVKWVYKEDAATGGVVRTAVGVTDDMFGLPVTESFDVAWNKIMENLWDIDNYTDMVEQIRRLSESDEFFKMLYDRLTDKNSEISENTKTQLEVTIKSAKLRLSSIVINPIKREKLSSGIEDNAVDLSMIGQKEEEQSTPDTFEWKVRDSEGLRRIRRYPTQWSNAFFMSDNVDVIDGVRQINSKAAAYIRSRYAKINAELNQYSRKKGKDLDTKASYEKITSLLFEVCNAIQIPLDAATLDHILSTVRDSRMTNHTQLNKLISFLNGNYTTVDGVKVSLRKWQKLLDGTIKTVISLHDNQNRNTDVAIRNRKGDVVRTLDRIYTTGEENAQINLVAAMYGKAHPSPSEFCVTGADGSLIYPISENNYMFDQVRNFNRNLHGKLDNVLNSTYGRRSAIAKHCKDGGKIQLHTFVELEDKLSGTSRDYFGITSVEDYIAKLQFTNNHHMVLPTMSDKKTWYTISGLTLFDDIIRGFKYGPGEDGTTSSVIIRQERRFGEDALNYFGRHFMDELDSVINYYKNKSYIEKNPKQAIDNYHGKIVKGKMQPGGNGGRFRFFNKVELNGTMMNLNIDLDKLERYNSTEDVLAYLQSISDATVTTNEKNNKSVPSEALKVGINKILIERTRDEFVRLKRMGIVDVHAGKQVSNKLIPENIIAKYKKKMGKVAGMSDQEVMQDILFSIVGNHVANTAMSIIEVEKCFTGDPAFFKWSKHKVSEPELNEQGKPTGSTIEYEVITQRDVDKIKRLSSVLSTGTNLRTYWGENDPRNNSEFRQVTLSDNQIMSAHYSVLYTEFKRSLVIDAISAEHPELSADQLHELVNTDEKLEAEFNKLSESVRTAIDSQAKVNAKPYSDGEVNTTDGAAIISPAMYKRIKQSLGEWSEEVEEAFNIIESDLDWMSDPKLYSKAMSLVLKPLKMVYFGDTFDKNLSIDVPVFDKMAIFPLFKFMAKGDNQVMYNEMVKKKVDMITFGSTVKVGSTQNKPKIYNDTRNTSFNEKLFDEASITTQDLNNLRLQLNTDPHHDLRRSMGTQAAKIGLSNVVDDMTYGENKGIQVKGSEIKANVMECINELTKRGVKDVIRRFYTKGEIDNKKLSNYLIEKAKSSGMSAEIIDGLSLDANGEFKVPIAAMSVRDWIETKISSIVDKNVADINTPGGSAIQMSAIGFKATGIREKSALNTALNGGKELNFLNEDGSMDCMLSMNFFRHIVPEEHQTSFGSMRKWLLKHNIIGKDSKPFAFGYRIPTQGLSSTFAFKVVDILPSVLADTVVVPDGFTAMTGSDFDVDKIYLATLSYDEKGEYIGYASDDKGVELPTSKQSRAAITNRLIESYLTVVSDRKNVAETRASIDTLTSILKKDIVTMVVPESTKEAEPMYELLPSFQTNKKEEYSSGKFGIAPFALNTTNHALTQFTHLGYSYSLDNKYGLGNLDAIKGRDGARIMDWLSAMVNAHVDVAKDPYIINLNVNQETYNMTNLLLRGGMGRNTFLFLPQPILKAFAREKLASKGVYGVKPIEERKLYSTLFRAAEEMMKQKILGLTEGSAEYNKWVKLFNGWLNFKYDNTDKYIGDPTNLTAPDFDTVFDSAALTKSLNEAKDETLDYLYQQLLVLNAYQELSTDARVIGELVHRSQIDTKKYGNTIALRDNFNNSVNDFINSHASTFFDTRNPNASTNTALRDYFTKTFLESKLYYATILPKKILKHTTFAATIANEHLVKDTLCNIHGFDLGEDLNGRLTRIHPHVADKEHVTNIAKMVETIIRARIVTRSNPTFTFTDKDLLEMFYGNDTACKRLVEIKKYIRDNAQLFPELVTESGTIINEFLNYLQEDAGDGVDRVMDRIILYNSSMNNSGDTENRLISGFSDLLEHTNPTIREFAEYLVQYAYITSFDNRSPNSFFHLIPMWYKEKIGYVGKVKEALQVFKSGNLESAMSMISEGIDRVELSNLPSIRITIVRNRWDDDSIVKPYVKDKSYTAINIMFGKEKNPIIFVANRNTDEFVKIYSKEDGKTYLYMRIGNVAFTDEKGETNPSLTKPVYQLIPKLGLSEGGVRIMELHGNSTDQSAFPQNNVITFTDEEISKNVASIMNSKYKKYKAHFIPGDNVSYKIRNQENVLPKSEREKELDEIANSVIATETAGQFMETEDFGAFDNFNDSQTASYELDNSNDLTAGAADFNAVDTGSSSSVDALLGQVNDNAQEPNIPEGDSSTEDFTALGIFEEESGLSTDMLFEQLGIPTEEPQTSGSQETETEVDSEPHTHEGEITSLMEDEILVFGSNTQGRHGAGVAKIATLFGAKYGVAEGRQGSTYAIITKDLTKSSHPSVLEETIVEQISKLYEYARNNPELIFKVPYTANQQNLSGYTSEQLAAMFAAAGKIPSNMSFEVGFKSQIDTATLMTQFINLISDTVSHDKLQDVWNEFNNSVDISNMSKSEVQNEMRKFICNM